MRQDSNTRSEQSSKVAARFKKYMHRHFVYKILIIIKDEEFIINLF
jgi:hypothetical protein